MQAGLSASHQVPVAPNLQSHTHIQFTENGNCVLSNLHPLVPLSQHISECSSGKSPCNVPQFSFAQLVDPNEGTELKFIPAQIINGTKFSQLEKSDVVDEIHYWQSAVLCMVLGANPPFEVMKGFFKRIWAALSLIHI